MVVMADHLSWLYMEWRKLTMEKDEDNRISSADRIKAKLESFIRQGSNEIVAKLINEIIKKLQEIFLSASSTSEERNGSLTLISKISSISAEEVSSQIPKFIHIIHLEITGRKDLKSMEDSSSILSVLIENSGILANELTLAEIVTSIERIQDLKNEYNVLGGVVTLLSLMNSQLSSLISQHLPSIFDVIWHGLFNSKSSVREKSAELLSSCLRLQFSLGAHNHDPKDALNIYHVYRRRIFDECIGAINSNSVPNIHGALLALKVILKLSEQDRKFVLYHEFYLNLLEFLMKLIHSKDSLLRNTSIDFVPLLAERNIFVETNLNGWLGFLIESIKKEKDRNAALNSLASTVEAIDAKSLEPFLDSLTHILKLVFQLKGKHRDMNDLNSALKCVRSIANTCGSMSQRFLLQLFPSILNSGLWPELIENLVCITKSIPNVLFLIEDSLMKEIKRITADPESNVQELIVAITCLGKFEYTDRILTAPLGYKLVQVFLNHSNSIVRCVSAETILKMCLNKSSNTLEPSWISRSFISAVLTRMVADEDFRVSERIILELKSNQSSCLDFLLAHADCIRPLFIFLGSNNVPIQLRIECADLLSRVSRINFSPCLPCYRKLLLQYLSEIECIKSPGLLHREDSAKLLFRILLWDNAFVIPYAEALLENILPMVEDKHVLFSESMINCIGRLISIKPDCISERLGHLLMTLQKLIQDQSSIARRRAALATLSIVFRKVERVKINQDQFTFFLLLTVSIVKNELDHSVRREAIRLMGVIGAIDPYLIKSLENSAVSKVSVDEYSESSSININSSPDEFYARIVVESLISILKDPTLSLHHMATAQSLVYLFRTLGQRSHQFLNQVLPALYVIIKNCPPSSAEFYFQQLAVLIGVVGSHIGPQVDAIVSILSSKWDSQQPCYPALLNLINILAQALKGEFRPYVHRIVPAVLNILESESTGISTRPFTIQKALQTVAVLGGQISDYAGVIGDAIVLLLRNSEKFKDVRIATLRTTASICKDVTAVADNPAILQSLLGILESSGEPDIQEYCLDAMVVVALAQGRDFFRFFPLVLPVINRRKLKHAAFDKLLTSNLNSPAKMAELTTESLKLMELKISDLTLVSGDFGGLSGESSRPLIINEGLLMKSFDPSHCTDREDWFEWIRRLGIELLRESPSAALRSCASLSNIYYPLGKELFNAALASCLNDLSNECHGESISAIEMALGSPFIPSEVAQQLLNAAEFLERQERPLPIGLHVLGTQAGRFHAYAKALYYKELEFTAALRSGEAPSSVVIEALISINNQVQQPDAALGILVHANRAHGIVLKESWYEKLQRWDEALKAYESKWRANPESYEAVFGILRCRHALGEWDELNNVAQEIWPNARESIRSAIAPIAAASAWGLQDWPHLEQYVQALKENSADSMFFKTILSINSGAMEQSRVLIDKTRDTIDTELTALLSESYSRAYNTVVRVQMLSELEEVSDFLDGHSVDPAEREILTKNWIDRLELNQPNVEVWLRILKARALIMTPKSDPSIWIRFASMCRKNGRPHLAHKILLQLLGKEGSIDSPFNLNQMIFGTQNSISASPKVVYACLKYVWECENDQMSALKMMKLYARHLRDQPDAIENSELLARCYYKASKWEKQLIKDTSSDDHFKSILDGYLAATSYDKTWHKAWHGWALMNFEMSASWERKQLLQQQAQQQAQQQNQISGIPSRTSSSRINPYIVPAIQGFFRSIALSSRNSLQDSLRLLTLWFKYGANSEINAAVGDGFFSVPVDNWLQVIPQLIARIQVASPQVRRLVHHVLSDIGRQHPQALVYSLSVAAKSQNVSRRTAAVAILDRMRSHSATLVDQALLVGQELIRVAILWEEMWHEGLEEASKLYFGDHNIPAMFGILEPLHELVEKGSKSSKEASFIQFYGNELKEARSLGIKYKQSGNSNDLNAAWDLYYQVFRRINKSLPQMKHLDLENVSPRLLKCQNLELAIPGTYRSDLEVVRISSIEGRIGVLSSKQRPRKLVMNGSDGKGHLFLLKGHEDLRQDERVMQLFGLVNALLLNDPETHKRHLGIERFAVIPLSQNTGLIGWLPQCDTMHTVIKEYREARGIPLSLEHRNMLQFAPDYDHLTKLQKMEVFSGAVNSTDGADLARAFWLNSGNAESWLERRTNYSRSLAVMSMTGYVLGLGDRHPSNLMFDQGTGKIVHIDFGDCFEVAMQRDRFPEQVPFRLTRMLIQAMEASGIEGTFRIVCEETLRVLRSNKDSVMAVLEAFVYDPLINWRLLNKTPPAAAAASTTNNSTQDSADQDHLKSFTLKEASSWAKFPEDFSNSRKIRRGSEITQLEEESMAKPEILNSGAISVINRVSSKLTGKDFRDMKPNSGRQKIEGVDDFSGLLRIPNAPHSGEKEAPLQWPLTVQTQVDRLIDEATRVQNLCQSYVGWCPFW